MSLSIVILAAGVGSRMQYDTPKIFHKIANKALINHVIDVAVSLDPSQIIIVVNKNIDITLLSHIEKLKLVYQEEQLGTGHAVSTAIPYMDESSKHILILYGDTPLITKETILDFYKESLAKKASVNVIGFDTDYTASYGRLIINGEIIEKIVEARDATKEELEVKLCNSGIILIERKILKDIINNIKDDNNQREYYLTDIVECARARNIESRYFLADHNEVKGVNSRMELSALEKIIQDRFRKYFMGCGVTLIDPDSVFFSCDTKIGRDVTIYPNVFFGPKVVIESDVVVKSFSHIEGAHIKPGAQIGPYARIRPGSVIGCEVVIGNFVEVKNAIIGNSSKISHLSYIGDSEIGRNTNIGAGVITCNYDGFNKYRTSIGDNVFIGSNTIIIAPVEVQNESMIGAGSVINKTVPLGSLAISRASLKILEGKADLVRAKNKNKSK